MSGKIDPKSLFDQDSFVSRLVGAGFSGDEAVQVLSDADNVETSSDSMKRFQTHFRNDDGSVNVAKVDAYMHIHDVKMSVDTYIPILENRADNIDNHTDLDALGKTIALMHETGISGQEIGQICSKLIKISKSFTPHPTEHHSPNGILLDRALVSAAEAPEDVRLDVLKMAVKNMAESDDFGASEKSNIVNEIDYSSECARVHNAGVNELDRQIEAMILDATGEHVDVHSDTAPRSWAYDADGKNNAEGFAMMMALATTTYDAMSDLSAGLKVSLSSDLSDTHRARIEKIQGNVEQVIANITPVYDRTRQINTDLATGDPKERETLYRQFYKHEYGDLFQQMSSIYDDADDRRGQDFYQDTVEQLDFLRKDIENTESAHVIDEAYRTIRRCGFGLDKGQTRHNDFVYIKMLDNMFDSDAFWGMSILSDLDREEIMQQGNFSNLDQETQMDHWDKILDYAKENGNRIDLVEILEDTNPLSFKPIAKGGNGYPEQEKTYVDRMRLRALYPFQFEEGVISDAQEIGSPRQKFIADLFGIVHMKHMSLNEDPVNLDRQDILVAQFERRAGADNIVNRQNKSLEHFKRLHQTLHVMRPASDAERNGGSFTRLQAMDQYRKVVREGYNIGVPVEIMIGGGGSLNRFGGDVDLVRRVAAQELKEIFKEKQDRGEDLSDKDKSMMIMATSILYTEQGRSKRIASATPGQVMDDFAGKMTNVLQDYLDMNGLVPDHTFIDHKTDFSEEMSALHNSIYHKAIDDYFGFANVREANDKGHATNDLLLDNYAEMGGTPNLIKYQNNGARAAAGKASGDKKAKTSGLRAIGKDQTLHVMQSFHAGFYSSGTAMKRVHEALHKGGIDARDVDDLMHNADWDEAIFSRNLIDAGRFNAEHLFNEISGDADKWDFDRVMSVGNEVVWVLDEQSGDNVLKYFGEEDVTQEELYLAKIYYDRAVFLALSEAALGHEGADITMKDSLGDIIRSVRPDGRSLQIDIGEKTQAMWPSVVDALSDGAKNAAGLSLYQMVDEDIQSKLDSGMSVREIHEEYGDGDADNFDARARQYGSAFRGGTMPHKAKWTGENSYGLDERRTVDMDEVIAYARTHSNDVDKTPDVGLN